MTDSSTTSWDAIADDWTRHADANDYRNVFLMPVTLELLGNVYGKTILDVGCGEGGYCRRLHDLGANVTGIDGSARLIETAVQRSGDAGHYLVRNANNLHGLADAVFDIVLATMSLMDVEDYSGSVSEVHRVLRPGGRFLMSITHPCFSSHGSKWKRHDDGHFEHYQVDRYFDRQAWEEYVTDKFSHAVLFRHMPLGDFINPLTALGFKMTRFHEPVPTEDQIRQSKRLERLQRIPLVLFMEWQNDQEIQQAVAHDGI
jgi:ubiquinone/menaquinone biosynthesis C-methylase UbiE